jgi:hypothetical protein
VAISGKAGGANLLASLATSLLVRNRKQIS